MQKDVNHDAILIDPFTFSWHSANNLSDFSLGPDEFQASVLIDRTHKSRGQLSPELLDPWEIVLQEPVDNATFHFG